MLFALLIACAHTPNAASGPFPDLAFERHGKSQQISALKGIRVVDVWATWCAPCQASLPHLEEIAAAYGGRGVEVIAISVDDDPATMESWLKARPEMDIQVGWTGLSALSALQIDGIPATFIVDERGQVTDQIMGYYPGDQRIEEALDRLLTP